MVGGAAPSNGSVGLNARYSLGELAEHLRRAADGSSNEVGAADGREWAGSSCAPSARTSGLRRVDIVVNEKPRNPSGD